MTEGNSGTRAVQSILNAALSAMDDDSDDFQSVVDRTRRSFRRNSSVNSRRFSTWKKKMILLRRSNADFGPGPSEIKYLTECGLGISREETSINKNWKISELENYIYDLYPEAPLPLTGFRFAKLDRQRKIHKLEISSSQSVDELKHLVGQGNLYLLPNRDIPEEDSYVPRNVPNRVRNINASDNRGTTHQPRGLRTSSTQVQQGNNRPAGRISNLSNQQDLISNQNRVENRSRSPSPLAHFEDDDAVDVSHTTDVELDLPILRHQEHTLVNLSFHRDNVVNEIFKYYEEDKYLSEKLINVSFINETGADAGGLTKELFSIFFKEIESQYFSGENALVPFLPLYRQRKEKKNYLYIGNILNHCLCLNGILPGKYAKSFILKLGNPDKTVPKNVILKDFMLHITAHEQILLKKALSKFVDLNEQELNQLGSFMHTCGLYEMPKAVEIEEQIMTIATEILIERPALLIAEMRQGINLKNFEEFWCNISVETISNILLKQQPTARKIISCLKTAEDLTNEQQKTLYYLQTYVRSLNSDDLGQFLFFVTGAYEMPSEITLTFTTLTGMMIRPITHTCSNVLELSVFYNSYQEFKRNINTYLQSEYSYQYTQL